MRPDQLIHGVLCAIPAAGGCVAGPDGLDGLEDVGEAVDGTPVNLYDGAGVQVDTDPWRVDAEWTADGARCAGQSAPPRRAVGPPGCYTARVSSSCGATSSFSSGTLLINEVQ